MEVRRQAKYSDQVFHMRVLFYKPEKIGYIGDWSIEWLEMMNLLNVELQNILAGGYGILDVNIVKTEPSTGMLFYADITYWNHP